jgi:hypothetical protein
LGEPGWRNEGAFELYHYTCMNDPSTIFELKLSRTAAYGENLGFAEVHLSPYWKQMY